jgi:hypothetical protein
VLARHNWAKSMQRLDGIIERCLSDVAKRERAPRERAASSIVGSETRAKELG